MSDFFANLVLGHLVGDYLLQNNWMAMNKSKSSFKCLVHCTIYTTTVALYTANFINSWLWWMWIFLSHYPIDRWELTDKYLKLIRGRSVSKFLEDEQIGFREHIMLRAGFTAFVYIVADNTFHLLLMWLGAKLWF